MLSDSTINGTVLAKDLTSYVTGSSPSGRTAVYAVDQQTTGIDVTPMSTV